MAQKTAYTAAAFKLKMDKFIAHCESEGIDATDYQLIKFFGISAIMLDKYRSKNILNNGSTDKSEGFLAAFRKLELYREDATIRQVVGEPKLTSHGALKLKQPYWGGWGDKQEASQDLNIRMMIGDGGAELLD